MCAIGITIATVVIVSTTMEATWRNKWSVPRCQPRRKTAGTDSGAASGKRERSGSDGADRANGLVLSARSPKNPLREQPHVR